MKTETQRVTITAHNRKTRAMRIRELMFRGYTLVEDGLHEETKTCKTYKNRQGLNGNEAFFDTDATSTKYIAVMSRVVPCKS